MARMMFLFLRLRSAFKSKFSKRTPQDCIKEISISGVLPTGKGFPWRRVWPTRWRKLQRGAAGGAGGGENVQHFLLGNRDEDIDDGGIELLAAGVDQAADGFVGREAAAIGAAGDHGVKGVDYGDDARPEGNIIAFKSGGIAAAIEALMMMEYIKTGLLKRVEEAKYRPSILRMLLHDGALFQ